MQYQKRINPLDNASNEPSKFRTKIWIKINDESRGSYNDIKSKTVMLKYSLYAYS